MNKTSNSIEVEKTRFFDCRKAMLYNLVSSGILFGLFAATSHYYLVFLVLFLLVGVLHPSYFINLRTPFRFEFDEGNVLVYYQSFKKVKTKIVPFERFVFVKQDWHKKKNDQKYTVSYSDLKHKNYYWLFMPPLHSWTHWDDEALDYLLDLAEKSGVSIKTWDYPIRWGS